jgi:hypothetical protein
MQTNDTFAIPQEEEYCIYSLHIRPLISFPASRYAGILNNAKEEICGQQQPSRAEPSERMFCLLVVNQA